MQTRDPTGETRPEGTPPAEAPRRPGPRPLALHLATATAVLMSSLAALPSARLGWLPWSPRLARRAADLAADLAAAEPEALYAALADETRQRLTGMLAGIEAYRAHPSRRNLPDPPVVWREGTTRLLDYGADGPGEDGPPVLFVPSLVNPAYVLDLSARRSLLRWLVGVGIRPLLVDWGAPGEAERGFDLTAYVAGRLEAALDAARELTGRRLGLVGYCMGGNLALALALRRGPDLTGLALLATPWDFHAEGGAQARLMGMAAAALDPVLEALGELPVDILQAFFLALDPALGIRKFNAFATLDPDGDAAADFVALEDWLNDGVPLTASVARECLAEWYGGNAPARGRWRVAGRPVDPAALAVPAFAAVPAADRIVPPASARALVAVLPRCEVLTPPSGHIGMVVGSRAEAGLWRPLAEWLKRVAA